MLYAMGTAVPFHSVREQARPELLWYLRHAQALERWPVLDERWAQRIEERRIAAGAGRDTAYLHGAGR